MAEPVEGRRSSAGRDEEAVRRFVERFALDLVAAGVPRMAARIFAAILVAEEGRRDAAELAESLRVSPAAVSGAVRYLTHRGLVAREREPGARRDHYRVHGDMWYQTVAHQDALLRQWERTLLDGIEAVGADSRAAGRLDETREFFEFFRLEMPALMERWRGRQAGRERTSGQGRAPSDPDERP
ncbi:MAG: MarR family transcriptional regulator [Streptosporangiales bacterium]|nr:MarR family transcriptional regulator [Streptosporangiales bacterium]